MMIFAALILGGLTENIYVFIFLKIYFSVISD